MVVCEALSAAAAAGPKAPKPGPAATTNTIRSVFIDNDERGRDPFFPKSARRQAKAVEAETPKVVGPSSLVLLGITGPPDRRIALINNLSFAAGEEQAVRIPGGSNSLIKCMEIRERSVMVTIQGGTEQFELQLLDRTLPIAPVSPNE
jgi:hypothetical protein